MNNDFFSKQSSAGFQVIGHRGSAGTSPENTLTSFRDAIEAGANAIELDIHKVENNLVVIHDDTVDRTPNSTGIVSEFTFAELRQLKTGACRIPTLDEVLEAVPTSIAINIELKGSNTAELAVEKLKNTAHSILVSSFDHRQLLEFSGYDTGIALAPLFHRWHKSNFRIAHQLDAFAINISRNIANEKIVTDIKRRGFRVYVYTVNQAEDAKTLERLGVDGIFSEFPKKIIES